MRRTLCPRTLLTLSVPRAADTYLSIGCPLSGVSGETVRRGLREAPQHLVAIQRKEKTPMKNEIKTEAVIYGGANPAVYGRIRISSDCYFDVIYRGSYFFNDDEYEDRIILRCEPVEAVDELTDCVYRGKPLLVEFEDLSKEEWCAIDHLLEELRIRHQEALRLLETPSENVPF
jgi:hypothetical protein